MGCDLDRKLQRRGHQENIDEVVLGDGDPLIAAGFSVHSLFQHLTVEPFRADARVEQMTV